MAELESRILSQQSTTYHTGPDSEGSNHGLMAKNRRGRDIILGSLIASVAVCLLAIHSFLPSHNESVGLRVFQLPSARTIPLSSRGTGYGLLKPQRVVPNPNPSIQLESKNMAMKRSTMAMDMDPRDRMFLASRHGHLALQKESVKESVEGENKSPSVFVVAKDIVLFCAYGLVALALYMILPFAYCVGILAGYTDDVKVTYDSYDDREAMFVISGDEEEVKDPVQTVKTFKNAAKTASNEAESMDDIEVEVVIEEVPEAALQEAVSENIKTTVVIEEVPEAALKEPVSKDMKTTTSGRERLNGLRNQMLENIQWNGYAAQPLAEEDLEKKRRSREIQDRFEKLWKEGGLIGIGVGVSILLAQQLGLDLESVRQLFMENDIPLEGFAGGFAEGIEQGLQGIETLSTLVTEDDLLPIMTAMKAGEVEAAEEAITTVIQLFIFGSFGAGAGVLKGALDPEFRVSTSEPGIDKYAKLGIFLPGDYRQAKGGSGESVSSALVMGMRKFRRELRELLTIGLDLPGDKPFVPDFVADFKLSNQAVLDREHAREQVQTAWPVKFVYDILCKFIDIAFEDRPIQRFWFLETVARMPYFAYMSALHLYETLGWWRSIELRTVHAAEEDNEAHHLMIMESLGGDQVWLDRFLAQHGAVFYYWVLVTFFFFDPKFSYNFSRLLEAHAVDTYGEFLDANAEALKKIPAPTIAVDYYKAGELYFFDKFQTSQRMKPECERRRPPCATLYDVFQNILDDESEHVKTMAACEAWAGGETESPVCTKDQMSKDFYMAALQETEEGRAAWKAWSEEFNASIAKKPGAETRQIPKLSRDSKVE